MTFADTQLDAEMAEWKRRISMFKDTEDFDEVTVQRLRLTLCGHHLAESILSQPARQRQHCVNGDRPSQWKMTKFDPSQNRNP